MKRLIFGILALTTVLSMAWALKDKHVDTSLKETIIITDKGSSASLRYFWQGTSCRQDVDTTESAYVVTSSGSNW